MIEEKIIHLLTESKKTLSVAESCTGGLITHSLTNIPGASRALKGGLITYQTDLKISELNIPLADLNSHGVVSKKIASLMAENIRKKWNTDFGLATTGYLGPDGGDAFAPMGTVWIAVSAAPQTSTLELHLSGARLSNKENAAQQALAFLQNFLHHNAKNQY